MAQEYADGKGKGKRRCEDAYDVHGLDETEVIHGRVRDLL